MTEVILKSEVHSSEADQEEELDILEDGVDALVLEGSEQDAEYGILEFWFWYATTGLFYIAGPVYRSTDELLIRLARYQGIEIYSTRKSDADILRSAPVSLQGFAGLLYLVLVFASVGVGVVYGIGWGAVTLFFAFFVPVLGLRLYNTYLNPTTSNRDRIMAEKIVEAAENHDQILAIVGAAHARGVRDNLPDKFDVDFRETKSTNLKDISLFLLRMVDVSARLLFVYVALLFVVFVGLVLRAQFGL